MTTSKHERILSDLRERAAKYQRDPPPDTPVTCRCCGVKTTWGMIRGDNYGDATVDNPYAFIVTCPTTGVRRKMHQPSCPCGRCARAAQQRLALMEKGWDGTGKTPQAKPRSKWSDGAPTELEAFAYMKCGLVRPTPSYARQFAQRSRRLRAAGYIGPVEWDLTSEESRDRFVAYLDLNPGGRI